MTDDLAMKTRHTVGVSDIPRVLFAPRRVFARVEDVPAYAWPLVVLLLSVTFIGYFFVETGLIDREVERQVQKNIAALELKQRDVVERSALSDLIVEAKKQGEFLRLVERVRVVVAGPIATVAVVLLVPAMFYGIVALTGRKPEWHTLVTVCVFASFTDVVGSLGRLGLMLRFRSLDIDTSLAPLVGLMKIEGANAAQTAAVLGGMLSAFDPFRIWFWLIVVAGLATTGQLRGWRAWGACCLFWMLSAGVRTAVAVSATQGPTGV